jgi:hypothetical protein
MALDPDMKAFQRVLQDTPAGKRFRHAWRTSRDLGALLHTWTLGSEEERRDIQRRYIDACEQASTCLDVLNAAYQWPEPFPSVSEGVIYRAPARARRQSPKAP